jgi:AcrR family transcriptional regulator
VGRRETTVDDALDEGLSRRELAVARLLDTARTRAESRVQRFLDAALELMQDRAGKEFTVQEVVERSGQSLRSFYQYFDGKYELLLALFEESVRATAELIRAGFREEDDELQRLHWFVVEYVRLCRPLEPQAPGQKPLAPVMVEFAQQLLTAHPKEAARAFAPLVSLFGEVLDEATAAGVINPALPRAIVVGVVLEAIMFNTFSSTIGGSAAHADIDKKPELLWQLIFGGIGSDAGRARVAS